LGIERVLRCGFFGGHVESLPVWNSKNNAQWAAFGVRLTLAETVGNVAGLSRVTTGQ
jgi:hypothetical protein